MPDEPSRSSAPETSSAVTSELEAPVVVRRDQVLHIATSLLESLRTSLTESTRRTRAHYAGVWLKLLESELNPEQMRPSHRLESFRGPVRLRETLRDLYDVCLSLGGYGSTSQNCNSEETTSGDPLEHPERPARILETLTAAVERLASLPPQDGPAEDLLLAESLAHPSCQVSQPTALSLLDSLRGLRPEFQAAARKAYDLRLWLVKVRDRAGYELQDWRAQREMDAKARHDRGGQTMIWTHVWKVTGTWEQELGILTGSSPGVKRFEKLAAAAGAALAWELRPQRPFHNFEGQPATHPGNRGVWTALLFEHLRATPSLLYGEDCPAPGSRTVELTVDVFLASMQMIDALVAQFRTGARQLQPAGQKPRSPRKRADRAAKIERLENEMIRHLRAARDHARATEALSRIAKLLPPPSQKELAKRTGMSATDVSRCLKDPAARELRLMWAAAQDLARLLSWSGRLRTQPSEE